MISASVYFSDFRKINVTPGDCSEYNGAARSHPLRDGKILREVGLLVLGESHHVLAGIVNENA